MSRRMAGGPGGSNGELRVCRCQGRHAGGRCPAPTMIAADRLEAWGIDHVKAAHATAASRAEPLLLAPRTWEVLTTDERHTIAAGTIDAGFLRRPPPRGADVSERTVSVSQDARSSFGASIAIHDEIAGHRDTERVEHVPGRENRHR